MSLTDSHYAASTASCYAPVDTHAALAGRDSITRTLADLSQKLDRIQKTANELLGAPVVEQHMRRESDSSSALLQASSPSSLPAFPSPAKPSEITPLTLFRDPDKDKERLVLTPLSDQQPLQPNNRLSHTDSDESRSNGCNDVSAVDIAPASSTKMPNSPSVDPLTGPSTILGVLSASNPKAMLYSPKQTQPRKRSGADQAPNLSPPRSTDYRTSIRGSAASPAPLPTMAMPFELLLDELLHCFDEAQDGNQLHPSCC